MTNLYDRRFYEGQRTGSRRSAEAVVPVIMRLIKPRSVCDVGCGLGTWLGVFRQHGAETILGIDGAHVAPELLQIPSREFLAMDLAQPLDLDRSFDLAVSLEVAEHLPAQIAPAFVRSLARLAPIVLFSAAVPGQGGTGHVNEQWQDYWANLFEAEGFLPIDAIRPKIWNDDKVEWFYRQNMLLYCRRSALANFPELAAVGLASMVSVLHPRFAANLNVADNSCLSEAMRALPRLLVRAIANRLKRRTDFRSEP